MAKPNNRRRNAGKAIRKKKRRRSPRTLGQPGMPREGLTRIVDNALLAAKMHERKSPRETYEARIGIIDEFVQGEDIKFTPNMGKIAKERILEGSRNRLARTMLEGIRKQAQQAHEGYLVKNMHNMFKKLFNAYDFLSREHAEKALNAAIQTYATFAEGKFTRMIEDIARQELKSKYKK